MQTVGDQMAGLLARGLEQRWLGPRGKVRRRDVLRVLEQVGLEDGTLPDQVVDRLNNPLFRRQLRRRPLPEPDAADRLPELIRATVAGLEEVFLAPADL